MSSCLWLRNPHASTQMSHDEMVSRLFLYSVHIYLFGPCVGIVCINRVYVCICIFYMHVLQCYTLYLMCVDKSSRHFRSLCVSRPFRASTFSHLAYVYMHESTSISMCLVYTVRIVCFAEPHVYICRRETVRKVDTISRNVFHARLKRLFQTTQWEHCYRCLHGKDVHTRRVEHDTCSKTLLSSTLKFYGRVARNFCVEKSYCYYCNITLKLCANTAGQAACRDNNIRCLSANTKHTEFGRTPKLSAFISALRARPDKWE